MKEVAMELEGLRILSKHPWTEHLVREEEAIGLMGDQPSDLFTVTIYIDELWAVLRTSQ